MIGAWWRLVALDLVGRHGRRSRRLVVTLELTGASLGCAVLGIWSLASGATVWGVVLVGLSLNYAPLACIAGALRRPELRAASVPSDSYRSYGALSLLLVIPYAVAALVLAGALARLTRPRSGGRDVRPRTRKEDKP